MTKRLTWFLTVVLVLASTTWLASVSAQKPASADVLLGQALHQEQSEGRLEDAIATYRKVLSAPDATKAQKARAQFQIGACYERLGLGEARKAYEAVVRDYPDQSEFAAPARVRLAALGSPDQRAPKPLSTHRVADGRGMALSPDGRFFATVPGDRGPCAQRRADGCHASRDELGEHRKRQRGCLLARRDATRLHLVRELSRRLRVADGAVGWDEPARAGDVCR